MTNAMGPSGSDQEDDSDSGNDKIATDLRGPTDGMNIDRVKSEVQVIGDESAVDTDFELQQTIQMQHIEEMGTGDTELASLPPSKSSRLLPIQVLLSPPHDPNAYTKVNLPTSWFVTKVLEEIDAGDNDNDAWYSVEFDDGRVDQLAYDDLRSLTNGIPVLERFQRDQSYHGLGTAQSGTKRAATELDSTDSDVSLEQPRMALRRSTRQKTTSRRPSPHHIMNHGFYEDLVEDDDDGDEGEDDEEDEFRKPRKRLSRNKSTTRTRNSMGRNHTVISLSSEDELANDSDGAFKPVTSDLSNYRPKRKGGRGRPSLKNRRNDRESSIEFEPTRKSSRAKKATNYIVPDVDDEYAAAEDPITGTFKHVSVKEVFPELPQDSEFAKMHTTTCDTCGGDAHSGKGPLIACQGCSYSFHKICLGQRSAREHRVTKIGPDHFVLQCKICVGSYQRKDATAPNHAMCQTCKLASPSCSEFSPKKTPKLEEKLRQDNGGEDPITEINLELVNNAGTLLFRCASCKRGYHFEHLPNLTQNQSDDLRADRLEEYAMVDWRCKDCVNSEHKIQALVAWRPVDQESYTTGNTCFDVFEDEKEYLVKWDKVSHFHDTWMPGAWIYSVAASTMRSSFLKREENVLPKMTFKEAVDEEWLLPDVLLNVKYHRNIANSNKAKDLTRISDVKEIFVKFQGLNYADSVWDKPPPEDSGAPYTAFRAAYEEYVQGVYFPYVSDQRMTERLKQFRALDFGSQCELDAQPKGLKRGKLMDYQIEGVNWMLLNFHKPLNIILADEMGLGKTVQVVSLITTLVEDKPKCWPFLIVVPNSTCPNWRRELKYWAPNLRVCTYHGGRAAQDLAFKHEIFPEGVAAGIKAHVVIMSYEAAVEAKSTFRSVKWAGLIVDEGQRLKNDKSLLYNALRDMKIPFRLLLTGTPLQNNKRELFNLLQFIEPTHNAEELDEKYKEMNKDTIHDLHELIRPYFLRRTKVQVLKFLPPMAQIILPVTMTYLQEKLSKSIISKNSDLIQAIVSKGKIKAGERRGLNNILMELRRVLCHPFLFSGSVEDRTVTDPTIIHKNLVEASGKLMLLSMLLPKLKDRGHRVLIFSQFLMSLTILEDFLTALGLPHARIDGNMSALEKQKRIDAYNEPNSHLFAMLLSTRAGGVGINLATADTVIIYDPDFNPHQDIQALSRAHRIGQKNKVLCFQMTTKDTVEEKIMHIGRKKMALDFALIEAMDGPEEAGDDLESILKHGAEALFSGDAQDKIIYDEASVDKLLDRSQIENTNIGDDESAESQFSLARVWANDKGLLTVNAEENAENENADPNVWENILKQRQEEHERDLAQQQREYGRGARRRNQDVRYNVAVEFIEGVNDDRITEHHSHVHIDLDASTDGDFNGEKQSEESDPEEAYLQGSPKSRARKGRKRNAPISNSPRTVSKIPRTSCKRTAPKHDNSIESPDTPLTSPSKKKAKTIDTRASNGDSYTSQRQDAGVAASTITHGRAAAAKSKRSPKKVPSPGPALESEGKKDQEAFEPGTERRGNSKVEIATATTTRVSTSEDAGDPANDISSAAASSGNASSAI